MNFERSVLKESILYSKLQDELNVVDQLNIKLAESETQYKTLFFLSPLPKWIYDIKSMMIVQVNNAAVNAYGYTKDELLKMSIMELTVEVDAEDLKTNVHQKQEQDQTMSILRQLSKKNGDTCYVDLKWASFLYKGKPSRIVIASDITERINHLQEIKRQNRELQEIAYIQAHVLRSPLTKIMSLTDLIRIEFPEFEEDPIFANLHTSTQELDTVIHDIIKHSEKALGNKL